MNAQKKETIRARLRQLETRAGRLTPDVVVREARNPKSDLHDQFEWNDKKAGHQWRLEQARRLIVSICYVESETAESQAVPCYVRDPNLPSNEQGYRSIATFRDDKQDALRLMSVELQRIEALLARLEGIAQVLGEQKRFVSVTREVAALRKTFGDIQLKDAA